jgi:hypothetical protein
MPEQNEKQPEQKEKKLKQKATQAEDNASKNYGAKIREILADRLTKNYPSK